MDILTRDFVSEIKEINEAEGTLTAYVSTNARDRMDEVLDPQGCDMSNYKKNPVVLWAHDYSIPPIGKAMWTKRDGNGIISKVKFAPTDFGQEVRKLYEGGYLKTFSVGFQPKKWTDGDGNKTPRRTYNEWELLEYSAVPVPANPEALAMAMSKGILVTDTVKKALGMADKIEVEEKEIIVNSGMNELIATNKSLEEKICYLEKDNSNLTKENQDLRYKLYTLLTENKKKLSEMADDRFVSKAHEIVIGAIRKAQGKID